MGFASDVDVIADVGDHAGQWNEVSFCTVVEGGRRLM